MTRDAELDFAYDISKSYLEKISQSLKKRQKGKPVRLVYDSSIHDDTLNFLMKRMGINKSTDSIIPVKITIIEETLCNFLTLESIILYILKLSL